MLRLDTHQLAPFRRAALSAFEEQMVEHCAAFSPRLAAALGRARLEGVIRAAITRAEGYGFTLRGPVRLFIELGLLFGGSFDTDVQYPWARESLARSEEISRLDPVDAEMDRAAVLYNAAIEAVGAIRGPDDCHIRAALRRVLVLAEQPSPNKVNDLPSFVLSALASVHPEKYAFVGESALRELIAAGADEATRHGIHAPRDVLLFVSLMFACGQGCTRDPIHAWIGQTLADDTLATPAIRMRQLEQRALIAVRDALANREHGR